MVPVNGTVQSWCLVKTVPSFRTVPYLPVSIKVQKLYYGYGGSKHNYCLTTGLAFDTCMHKDNDLTFISVDNKILGVKTSGK